jgi:DNA-directed RNA polymerase alpha subunit
MNIKINKDNIAIAVVNENYHVAGLTLSSVIINKLHKNNIYLISDLIALNKKKLSMIDGIGRATAATILCATRRLHPDFKVIPKTVKPRQRPNTNTEKIISSIINSKVKIKKEFVNKFENLVDQEILSLSVDGMNCYEIAEQLNKSCKTIKRRIEYMLFLYDCNEIQQLVYLFCNYPEQNTNVNKLSQKV